VKIIPLQRAHHHGECVVVVRDVSQQIRAERAREEFITQVTHELRTPLTNIRAYTETLSSGMFDDPKLLTECYNVITKETRRLSRLVEDILSVSQLEVGTIDLKTDDVDLRTLLTDSVRDVRGLADEKNIDLRLALPSKMEPIRADRDKLAVVLNNLLGNAIKYTPAHGNVVVGCQFAAGDVTLTVKDSGIGIGPADQARIFEKFQRACDPAVKDIPGTGIGLYTAREIVRRHGGEVEVISEKGKGSTFLVRLPHQGSRAAAMSTGKES
jgi:signal transduction histidine kinase